MNPLLPPHYFIALGTASLFFIFGFLFVSFEREPITVTVNNETFVPIEVAKGTFEEASQVNPSVETEETPDSVSEETSGDETRQPETTTPVTRPSESTESPLEAVFHTQPAPVQTFANKDLEALNTKIQKALVNILCLADGGSPVNSISGSGIIIDPSGTILTNAHIAENFLLQDYPFEDAISCVIRTGSPATPQYTAELAYISPLWVLENADALIKKNPTGTGEHDFALLTITGTTEFGTLPETFPYIPISFEELRVGDTVISAGYPASFLSSQAIQQNLVQISSAGTIRDIFTFDKTSVDVLSLGGVPLAQQGASGGAVVKGTGNLVGLVVTSSLEEETQERDLRAISLAHIARSFSAQHGTSFASYAFGDITPEYEEFSQTIAPQLRAILEGVLTNN